jgi:hypothetical protein
MKTNSSAVIIPAPSSATNAAGTNALAGDIRDIKAPVDIPNGWFWLWCVLGALAVAALSYVAWRYWRKHRAQSTTKEIIIPPHERARRKLQEALKLIYDPRPFCIAVSDTLRTYLEEAFSLRAPERTTEEFLDELQSSALLSLTQKQSLADFLMRCDLVKFARDEPTGEQLLELHESALRLVDETSYFQPRSEVAPSVTAPSASQGSARAPLSTPHADGTGGVQEDTAQSANHESQIR